MAPALFVEQLPSSTFVATEDKAQTMSNVEVRSKSTLDELADQIQQNANIISDFLQSNGHQSPSFERNAPTYTLPTSAPSEIRVAREALMGAALQIFQLAAGPSEYLPNVAVGVRKRIFF
jgi:6-hydroxytryprostatin B O-methyltransferase